MVIDDLHINIEPIENGELSIFFIHEGNHEGVEIIGNKDYAINILQEIITKIQNND